VSHEPEPEAPEFSTTDIALASFLVVRGHVLSHLDGPPNLTSFVFAAVDPGEVELYRLGEPVSAVLLATMIRRLFARIRRRQHDTAKAARVGPGLSGAPLVKPTKVAAASLEPA
jgi:hypothetical protein